MQLNEEQRAAVDYVDGPQVIVAGPGSGKTRVIISKIEHLVSQLGMDPARISAITFSNKAAEEMKERLAEVFPYRSHEFNVHTFHSLCWNIVQEFAAEAGFKNGVRVLDQTASWVLVRQHIEEFGLRHYLPNSDPFRYIFDLLGLVSRAKDEGVTPQIFASYTQNQRVQYENSKESFDSVSANEKLTQVEKLEELSSFYKHYQQIMLQENCIDYGDQIALALKLLIEHSDVRNIIQSRWDYILVDEFQDTNVAQIEILKLLTKQDARICVVGDPDQSIYRFRGASFASFIRFDEAYPKRKPFALTRNYRSTKNILDTATRLISNNADRYQAEKPVWTDVDDCVPVTILKAPSFSAEAEAVAAEISSILLTIHEAERRFGDFAILYRAHSHKEEIITSLERRNIPYKIVGGSGFYKKEEIKDIYALMKGAADREDGVALHRVISLSDWSIPQSDIKAFSRWMNIEGNEVSNLLERIDEFAEIDSANKEKIKTALNYIINLKSIASQNTASESCRIIFETTQVLKRYLYDDSIDSRQRAANLAKYLQKVIDFEEDAGDDKSAANFVEYQDYLLDSGADEEEAEINDTRDAVNLMTVHAAKGLEWPFVFVVSMSSARFPSSRKSDAIPFPDDLVSETAPQGDFHIQEERRLAYVAFTRAKRQLYLSCVEKKGKKASVFIQEVSSNAATVVEKIIPEVSFNAEIEPASMFLIAERDIRRYLTKILDTTEDIKTIQPYLVILSAIRKVGKDPNAIQQLQSELKGEIDSALQESIEDIIEKQFVISSVTASASSEPIYMSYSRMSAYEDCPLSYKFSYELKIQSKSKPYFSFGNTVHLSLNSFFEEIKSGKEPTLDDLKNTYQDNWKSEGYVLPSQEAGYRRDGESFLERFYKRYLSEKVIPLHLEWKFTLPIGNHFVTGYVDRIDPLGDGTCSILDYKTGKSRKQKDVDADMQLTMYALAVQEILGLKAQTLSLYFLNSDEIISTTRTDEQIEALKDHIISVAESICARNFEAKYDAYKCGRCDYGGICPVMEK